jgi:diacylglycerol kinase (ATP)
MTSVAVVAHARKQLGGGLGELRERLSREGVADPMWFEVQKSKKAPSRVRRALDAGAELVFVWGGDGMVQRCIDVLAGTHASMAILPAGTANLLATNLGIPHDLEAAVDVGLNGDRRLLDVGVANDERFAVMAGAGFDALMMRDADRGLKDRVGRLAYVVTGAKHLSAPAAKVRIRVDGAKWFSGEASCVLMGNVGQLFGGVTVFDDARPDDGRLELGLVTADGAWQWTRTLARTAVGSPEKSPFVHLTSGQTFDIKWTRKMPYELDGGDRPAVKRLRASVEPHAISVCVPEAAAS